MSASPFERVVLGIDAAWTSANQSGVASNQLSAEAARACFERTVELLGLPVEEIVFCPHPAFPVGCFALPRRPIWATLSSLPS